MRPAAHPWEQPGWSWHLRDAQGNIWPPGFVSKFDLPTSAQTQREQAARAQVHQRQTTGKGWGAGTLHLPGTPKHGPPKQRNAIHRRPQPRRGGEGTAGWHAHSTSSMVWRLVQILHATADGIPAMQAADMLGTDTPHMRAAIQRALERGVFEMRPVPRSRYRAKTIHLGPNAHLVRLKA